MRSENIRGRVELRETDGGPVMHGVLLTEGRAASGRRRELFAPGAVVWPESGIEIRTVHLGRTEAVAVPVRQGAEIHVSVPATPALAAAVRAGKDQMSVEFHAVTETRTASGIREIERAIVTGAIVTDIPEYQQTRAELRERRRVRPRVFPAEDPKRTVRPQLDRGASMRPRVFPAEDPGTSSPTTTVTVRLQ